MSQRVQAVLDDELAQAVKKAAASERRSVSEWIALRLEEVLDLPSKELRDDPEELARREAALARKAGPCRHQGARYNRRTSKATGLLMETCGECDEVVPAR